MEMTDLWLKLNIDMLFIDLKKVWDKIVRFGESLKIINTPS